MIRFSRIFELFTDADRRRFEETRALFRTAFPHEPEAIDQIGAVLKSPRRSYEPILLVAEDHRRHVTGLAFLFFFPEAGYGYLQYIASDPNRAARGIGAALHEGMRELLAGRGAQGLFLDVPPVDDDAYLGVLKQAIRKIERFKPKFLVMSLGYDIMRGDPTGSFSISPQGKRRIGHTLGTLGHPLLIVQEGGYSVRNLRLGAHAFLLGLANAWYGR